jgi:hypothetical protein
VHEEPYPSAAIWRAFVLAETDREGALRIYGDLQRRDDIGIPTKIDAVNILMLIGEDLTRVQAELRKLKSPEEDQSRNGYSDAMFRKRDFLLGEMPEDEYLNDSEDIASQLVAQFTAALRHLCEGTEEQKEEAKKHFRAALALDYAAAPCTHWSQAFLERLDDPDWPARIQRRSR